MADRRWISSIFMIFVRIGMVCRNSKRNLYKLGLTYGIFQVPVIAVFTKYDQFEREIRFRLQDQSGGLTDPDDDEVTAEAQRVFNDYYKAGLGERPSFVCLKSKDLSL
jgi:hypothetical protein